MNKLIEVNESTFEAEVLQSPVPVLVDFYGDYCGPCKLLKPVLVELANDVGDSAKVVTVDIQANEQLTTAYKINVVPTLITFKDGKQVQRLVGVQDIQVLREALGV